MPKYILQYACWKVKRFFLFSTIVSGKDEFPGRTLRQPLSCGLAKSHFIRKSAFFALDVPRTF